MSNTRPVIPLVREDADIRYRHRLTDGSANTDIFGGWGVRLLGPRIW